MKHAILIGYSADKRTARPLTAEAQPFDEALADWKAMNAAREGPAPYVELWTARGMMKSARFQTVQQPKGKQGGKATAALERKLAELTAAHEDLIKRNEELEKLLTEARAPKQQSEQQQPLVGDAEQPELGAGSLVPRPT